MNGVSCKSEPSVTVGLLPRLGSLTPSSSLIKIVLPSPAGSKASLPKISVWVFELRREVIQ